VEHYACVRHAYYNDGKSQREIASLYGINRRTIKKMVESSAPAAYKRSLDPSVLKVAPHKEWIDEILASDQKVHKKQRHSVLRIFNRLKDERNFNGGYTIVREYIAEKRLKNKEMFIPLIHEPGMAQCDFGEADAMIGGKMMRLHYLVMQLPYSDAFFVKAYPAENTESFCDGHRSAFDYFGGVPKIILYDNTKIAISKILKAGKREKTQGFLRLKSHYLFESNFANPASGNEKGGVENMVGYIRRNFMVPIPTFDTIDAFNDYLSQCCTGAQKAVKRGHDKSVKDRLKEEAFLPLTYTPYEAFRFQSGVISSEGLVRFDNNDYSVPVHLGPQKVFIKGYAMNVAIIYKDKIVAKHQRLYGKAGVQFNPIHYLSLLTRKSRAFHQAAPLKNWTLPYVFDRVHQRLLHKDPDRGTRHYIEILRLLEAYHVKEVEAALIQAMRLDCVDLSAIRHLLNRLLEGKSLDLNLLQHPHIPHVIVAKTDLSAYSRMMQGSAS
jgi:transposase